jgi:hypothetical protein
MRKLSRRTAGIALTVLVGLSAAGAAWAAWSLTGSGEAQARAGSVVTLKVTSAGLPPGGLTPGNTNAVWLNVENPNKFPVRITSIALTSLKTTARGCDAEANVTIVDNTPLPSDPAKLTVPAGDDNTPGTAKITWDGPLKMVADPDNACQSAGFTFVVHLDAVSAAV